MSFGLHCARLICEQYKLPSDLPPALARIIDREISTYGQTQKAVSLDRSEQIKAGTNIPPHVDEVRAYIAKIGGNFTPEAFCAHYESNGWKVGKNKMVNWQAACRTWSNNDNSRAGVAPVAAQRPRTAFDIQTRLEACRKELRDIVNPGGAAWPIKPTGEAAIRANELQEAIRKLETELCRA
jgi:hypothetical protein